MSEDPNYQGERLFYWRGSEGPWMLTADQAGETSDGYHEFSELYDHRCLLWCLAIRGSEELGMFWKSRLHSDGSAMEGWFITGLKLETGSITYHLPDRMRGMCQAVELERAPEWDGHTSADVIKRLEEWLR